VLVDEVLQRLALEQAAPAQRPVGEDLLVELDGDLLHGEGIVAAGVERTDDRAGAGADHVIRDDALRFEHLDHADVGEAARRAAAEGEADLDRHGSRRGWGLLTEQRATGKERDGQRGEQEVEVGAHGESPVAWMAPKLRCCQMPCGGGTNSGKGRPDAA
jgi:hypothetical protein